MYNFSKKILCYNGHYCFINDLINFDTCEMVFFCVVFGDCGLEIDY